ncbi:MAG: S8 family serine peptidase [Candidatus Sumerlaeaceae bacterium]
MPKTTTLLAVLLCLLSAHCVGQVSHSALQYSQSTTTSTLPAHVPGIIVLKLRDDTASRKIQNALEAGKTHEALSALPQRLQALNAQYGVKGIQAVFPKHEQQLARLNSIHNKDMAAFTPAEKHLKERLNRAPAGATTPALNRVFRITIAGDDAALIRALEAYRSLPEVEYAELGALAKIQSTVPNDPQFPQQWALHNSGQAYPFSGSYNAPPGAIDSDIDAPEAWDITTGSGALQIAVIDTGVDYNHRDLVNNMWTNQAEASGAPGVDDDNNGYVDDIRGYDFTNYLQVPDNDPMDQNGHGTHCAGIIAAEGNNGLDITGVLWRAKIMAVKSFASDGNGSTYDAATAIQYAVNKGADVVSLSWGAYSNDSSVANAIAYAESQGVLVLAAAGNDNQDGLLYPALYDTVLAIGASNSLDQRAPFSNYGWFLDVAAPGVDILSLRAAGTSRGAVQTTWTTVLSGTSMACPYAAGVAGLAVLRNPTFTLDQLRSAMKMPTDQIAPDKYIGQGRANAAGTAAVNSPPPVADLKILPYRFDVTRTGGVIPVDGTASGGPLQRYDISYGVSVAATTWTVVTSSTTAVNNGILGNLNTAPLWKGLHSIRIAAYNAAGRWVEDQQLIDVENFKTLSPANNDVVRPTNSMQIKASIRTPLNNLTIEHGEGYNPVSWTTSGIAMQSGSGDLWATWNTSSITTTTFSNLRFTIATADGTSHTEYAEMFYLDPRLRAGFPVRLPRIGKSIWHADFQDVAVDDLDGDGQKELVTIQSEPLNLFMRLCCYSPSGQLNWSYTPFDSFGYPSIPCIADINGDGKKEVFLHFGGQSLMYAVQYNGTNLPGWPATVDTWNGQCTVADLNHDGTKEFIAVCSSPSIGSGYTKRELMLLSPGGATIRRIDLDNEIYGQQPPSFACVGQFDSDPDLEICTNYGAGKVAIFNMDGTILPGWPFTTGSTYIYGLSAGDVDHDGFDEVAVSGFEYPNSVSSGVHLLSRLGADLPGWPVQAGNSNPLQFNPAALADFDGDGDLEIAFSNTGKLFVYHHSGVAAAGWPKSLTTVMFRGPIVGDITGDGVPDLVVSSGGIRSSVVSAGSFSTSRGIQAWQYNGTPIDLNSLAGIDALFFEDTNHISNWKCPPVLTDLDGNGLLDIVAGVVAEVGYGSSRSSSQDKLRNSIYAWELPVAFNASSMWWPTFCRNAARTQAIPQPPPAKIEDWQLH